MPDVPSVCAASASAAPVHTVRSESGESSALIKRQGTQQHVQTSQHEKVELPKKGTSTTNKVLMVAGGAAAGAFVYKTYQDVKSQGKEQQNPARVQQAPARRQPPPPPVNPNMPPGATANIAASMMQMPPNPNAAYGAYNGNFYSANNAAAAPR